MIWIDARLPQAVEYRLRDYGHVYRFKSEGIVYDAIACHPDIFMTKLDNTWVLAPNIPLDMLEKFEAEGEKWIFGSQNVGATYPQTAIYNIAFSDQYVLGNLKDIDPMLRHLLSQIPKRIPIQVNQGYARCNALFINNTTVICSDKSIEKALKENSLQVLYIEPAPISLKGFPYGFLGGCCGIKQNKVFFTGSLSFLPQADEFAMRDFLALHTMEVIELGNHPLIDGGGILFS